MVVALAVNKREWAFEAVYGRTGYSFHANFHLKEAGRTPEEIYTNNEIRFAPFGSWLRDLPQKGYMDFVYDSRLITEPFVFCAKIEWMKSQIASGTFGTPELFDSTVQCLDIRTMAACAELDLDDIYKQIYDSGTMDSIEKMGGNAKTAIQVYIAYKYLERIFKHLAGRHVGDQEDTGKNSSMFLNIDELKKQMEEEL